MSETKEVIAVEDIAGSLGEVYFIKKDAEKELGDLRTQLFDSVTASFDESSLAQKRWYVANERGDGTLQGSKDYAVKFNSGWEAIEGREDGPGYEILLREDPALKQKSIVVESDGVVDSKGKTHPGYVVTKTVRKGSDLVNIETMEVEDEDLFWDITEWPKETVRIVEILFDDQYALDAYLMERVYIYTPQYGRVLKDPSELTSAEIEKLKEYVYEGPKQLALNVRYAKPDEIGTD
jgi:hypothetical protein